MTQRIPQQQQSQLQLCQVCKFQPAPQSYQFIPFIVLQIILLFFNAKISIILLLVGYSFSDITWKCPICKRQIFINQNFSQFKQAKNNIIIRMGKCIGMVSKTKFRVLSSILIIILLTSIYYTNQNKSVIQPTVQIKKTWQSLAKNCGYQAFIQNSYRANYLYTQYIQSGNDWLLQPIYIGQENLLKGIMYKKLKVKMDPSQFADPLTHDFTVLIRQTSIQHILPFQIGDVLRVQGQWEGRIHHEIIFSAISVQKTDKKKKLDQIKLINFGSLRTNQ